MDILLKMVGGAVSIKASTKAYIMTKSHVHRHFEARSPSMMSPASTEWCVNMVINHTTKLISQQSVALDRWKSTHAHRKEYTSSHTHTNCTVICVKISQCLCRDTVRLHRLGLLLPGGYCLHLREEGEKAFALLGGELLGVLCKVVSIGRPPPPSALHGMFGIYSEVKLLKSSLSTKVLC